MKLFKDRKMLVVTLLAGLGLLMAAGIHRGQLGSPDYAQNWLLIRLEAALVMAMIFLVLANLVLVFRGLFSGNGRVLSSALFGIVVGVASTVMAMMLDSPTLVHAT
ncbi:MAG: hypothetical protein JNM63_12710 [Spirochaetia bacterium]|nr:hypothetical protein [Spirochaetia bacterium]